MIEFASNCDLVELPKWSAVSVKGKTVTRDQAAEIIIKTDKHMPDFLTSSDGGYGVRVCELFNIPSQQEIQKILDGGTYMEFLDKLQILTSKLRGDIELEYLQTDEIVSDKYAHHRSWIGWDGNIELTGTDIGKWATVSEIAKEWDMILTEFPYLELTCQLYSDTVTNVRADALIEFAVGNGKVRVTRPTKEIQPSTPPITPPESPFDNTRRVKTSFINLKNQLERIYGEIPQYE